MICFHERTMSSPNTTSRSPGRARPRAWAIAGCSSMIVSNLLSGTPDPRGGGARARGAGGVGDRGLLVDDRLELAVGAARRAQRLGHQRRDLVALAAARGRIPLLH